MIDVSKLSPVPLKVMYLKSDAGGVSWDVHSANGDLKATFSDKEEAELFVLFRNILDFQLKYGYGVRRRLDCNSGDWIVVDRHGNVTLDAECDYFTGPDPISALQAAYEDRQKESK